jgi:hypothetical protein
VIIYVQLKHKKKNNKDLFNHWNVREFVMIENTQVFYREVWLMGGLGMKTDDELT